MRVCVCAFGRSNPFAGSYANTAKPPPGTSYDASVELLKLSSNLRGKQEVPPFGTVIIRRKHGDDEYAAVVVVLCAV